MSEENYGSSPPYPLEKGEVAEARSTSPRDYQHYYDAHGLDGLQRRLKQRHIQMIAIAGTIGTGLFLGSGGALATAGPLGALIAYILVGTVVYSTLCSVGELTCWAPISGTFPHFAGRWVDPALGFAVGWVQNYFYGIVIGLPAEISAANVLLTFWDPDVIWAVMVGINLFGTRWFGEAEFFFAVIKLSLIIALLLAGLIIDLGGGPNRERIGFRYWKHPGALNRAGLVNSVNTDRFLAWISVLVQASYSFLGVEMVAIAASETENPRRNIAKAIGRVFWRILVFYVLGILMIGMLVAYNDDALLQSTGTAAQSPFVIAMNRAGVEVFPHIINACVFSSAFSAGNTGLFGASRVLYGLALRGQAPKFFTKCTKRGLPLPAVLFCSGITLLAFMTVSKGGETVFKFQPWLAYWGMFWNVLFTLVTGYEVFFRWNTSKFITSYINIPIFFGLYFLYKIPKRSKVWKASEMDFYTGIPSVEETETYIEKRTTLSQRVFDAVF
ncbi:hypothetical protein NP233_g2055 [Leucocoprinus birnbaumii]|uniref:Amino acid permease/ SLC12A domain-containing protein n=1 Tax=Leucocoprinus birnbaumii TaxID=56174 RepID=A0AAD5W223_9AGAR|nr:hypothetical protein NP233_g2055 [Leucocoprinus birnbaumii]